MTKIECFVWFLYSNSDIFFWFLRNTFRVAQDFFLPISVIDSPVAEEQKSKDQFQPVHVTLFVVKIIYVLKLKLNILSSESSQMRFSFIEYYSADHWRRFGCHCAHPFPLYSLGLLLLIITVQLVLGESYKTRMGNWFLSLNLQN